MAKNILVLLALTATLAHGMEGDLRRFFNYPCGAEDQAVKVVLIVDGGENITLVYDPDSPRPQEVHRKLHRARHQLAKACIQAHLENDTSPDTVNNIGHLIGQLKKAKSGGKLQPAASYTITRVYASYGIPQ